MNELVIAAYGCPVSSIELLGEFKRCNALLNWLDHHVIELSSSGIVELSKGSLRALHEDLSGLSVANCRQRFPTIANFVHGGFAYDEGYRLQVAQLRQWCGEQLEQFDFAGQKLFLRACW